MDIFEEIREDIEILLQNPNVKGVAAERTGQEFVLSYFKDGGVFDRTIQVKPPQCRDRERWYTEVIPEMERLDRKLTQFANELNLKFRKEYANLLREQAVPCFA